MQYILTFGSKIVHQNWNVTWSCVNRSYGLLQEV